MSFIFAEAHFFDSPIDWKIFVFDMFEAIFGLLFVVNMDFGKAFSRNGEWMKFWCEGDARQFAFKVGGVAIAIVGMME